MKEIMYESLLHFRIRKILMICSNYDAFILHEDRRTVPVRSCGMMTASTWSSACTTSRIRVFSPWQPS